MSRYLQLTSKHRPFALPETDANNRAVWSMNFEATAAAPVNQWEEELAKVISTAGLGTLGTDLFVGPIATIPTGAGPYVHILDTGGIAPIELHGGERYERLSAQILVRGAVYGTVRTRALAIWRAVDSHYNVTLVA